MLENFPDKKVIPEDELRLMLKAEPTSITEDRLIPAVKQVPKILIASSVTPCAGQ